ncbi:Microcystin-dependent protein [Methylobacterium sp. 174MFSha1.1]|uniref:phage tail protein n=1 Tax=Methylobacterium sp. 174MFSha1.1 TaxID=1502749 RepID=UPI0008E07C33|nr:tail fiber protein [Methylobacterium sp. 174MFSha1.1]SFV08866.1 Microcystin-dependent protein [Methylobacterium sp. 174MFSha1.1]
MTDAFLGEIRLFPYSKIPKEWLPCNGQAMNIRQYAALYSLLGVRFGGDSVSFNLPNLNGCTIVGAYDPTNSFPPQVGNKGGTETVTLTAAQMPPHIHMVDAASTGTPVGSASGAYFAAPILPPNVPAPPPAVPPIYGSNQNNNVGLNSFAVTETGGGQAHENRQPYLVQVYAICNSGIYPPRQ